MSQPDTLWEEYINGTLAAEQLPVLLLALQTDEVWAADKILLLLEDSQWEGLALPGEKEMIYRKTLEQLRLQPLQLPARRQVRFRPWMAAAAVLLLVAVSIAYLYNSRISQTPVVAAGIRPGDNKAILTLGTGEAVVLDNAAVSTITDHGVTITRLKDGAIQYQAATGGTPATVSYNTLSTPKGGQFRVRLPDGSQVWLNAASKLRYPTAFTGKERTVMLEEGEAFFEVAADKGKVFHVQTHTGDIAVLGTSFNVNAYADEPQQTATLVTGAVQVSVAGSRQVLRPGQQALWEAGIPAIAIRQPSLTEVLAWKEGDFRFEEADIAAIMRQLQRWYDMEVTYNGDVAGIRLSGVISRKEYADELLKAFELTGKVKFVITGKRVVVMPGKR